MAGSAIDLDEIAMPEILDPRQVKGMHSGARGHGCVTANALRQRGVLRLLRRIVLRGNGPNAP